jgi:hypothetical protein
MATRTGHMATFRGLLWSMPAKAWAAVLFVCAAVAVWAIQRILDYAVPEGEEQNVAVRALQGVREMMGIVPLDWLVVAAITALSLFAWDERQNIRNLALAAGRWFAAAPTVVTDDPPIALTGKVRKQETLPKGSPLTKWVQVVVDPLGDDLIDCEVQIVSLYRNDELLYDEPLNCVWSNSQDIRRTIRRGIPQSASLCMATADAGKPGLYLTTSLNKPQIMRPMRRPERATYRVDVAVYAANSQVKRGWFVVEYGGSFEHISIRPDTQA